MVSDGGTVKRLGADNFATDLLALSSEAALDVAADYIVFLDGGATGGTKKEQLSDVVGNMAGNGLAASSGVLAVGVDDSSIELSSDAVRVKAEGITNAMLAGSIANAKLSNSAVTIGSTSVSLGATSTSFSGLTGLDFTAANATIAASLGANTLTLGASTSTVAIAGNLSVAGTTTTVNSTAVEIGDRIIELNTAGAAGDAGLYVQDAGSENTGSLLWDTSADRWFAGVKGAEVNLVTVSSTDTLTNKTLTSPDVNAPDIDGGTIDGATIATSDITVGSGKTLNVSGGTLTLANDQIAAAKVTGLDGAGLADSSGVLSVNVDDSSIEINSDTLRVKAAGIAHSMLANDAVDGDNIADDSVNSEHIAQGALDAEHYASGSIENGHLAGSIANAKLANSSITVTDGSSTTAIALGNAITFSGTNNEVEVGESSGTITIGLPNSVQITTGLSVPTCGVTTTLAVGGGYGSTGLTVDTNGNLTMDGNLSVGVNTSASDVAFYGADSGDGLFWDGDNSRLGLDKSAQAGYAIDVKQGAGDVRADSFVTYSDRELKHNIVAIDDSLDKIMKLDAVSYDMKNSGRHEIGFIAQEVAKVVPEICALDNNGVGRGIDYGRLTSLLAGAVKTQQNQIAELKAAIAKLDK